VSKRSNQISLFVLILGPVLLFGPMILRGEVLFWGTPMLQFVPWHRFARDLLLSGQLPLWNPWVGLGAPLVANYQSAIFYPPNLLLLIIGAEAGHGLLVMLHLIWAGLGMRALGSRLGLSPPAQMISGLAFSLSGYLVARSGFISINHTAAWLPWILLCTDRLIDKIRAGKQIQAYSRPLILLSLVLAMQWLAGHAQTAWYTLVMVLAWATWRMLCQGERGQAIKVMAALAVSGILAFILSAVQLLPTLEYLLQSSRAEVLDVKFAMTYSFWPWRLLGLVFPDLFGTPVRGDFWGYGNYWEDAIYIGILPFILAVIGAWKALRSRERKESPVVLLLVVSILAFMLALGNNTPLFPFLFRFVPTFDLFQAPARWNLLLVFCLALLAGFGLDQWRTPSGRGLYWTRLGTAGVAIIGLAGYLGAVLLGGVEPTFVRAFALAGVWLALSGLLTLFLPKSLSPPAQLILGAFLLFDLVTAGSGLNPSQPSSVYQGGSALQQIQRDTGTRIFMPADVEYAVTFERTHRFDTFSPDIEWVAVRDVGIPNTAMLDSIPSVNNFDPLTTKRYQLLIKALPVLPQTNREAILALMNVASVAEDTGSGPLGVEYAPIKGAARLWFFPTAEVVDSPETALEIMAGSGSGTPQTAILEGPLEIHYLTGGNASTGGIETDLPAELQFTVAAAEGTWVVVSDSYYPGWRAEIDGQQTNIFPAFVNLRGLWVPPGEHTIRMTYHPVVFNAGAILSILGWISCAGVLLRWSKD